MLALGLSTRSAALLLYAVCGISASLAILESFTRKGFGWSIVVIFCCLVLVGIDRLGYVELTAMRKVLSQTFVRRAVQDHIFLEELEDALLEARTVEEWWAVACNACAQLRFQTARLELDGRTYKEQFGSSTEDPTCSIHLRLGDRGFLLLTRAEEKLAPRNMMAALHRLQCSIDENGFAFASADAVSGKGVITSNAA